MTSKTQRIRDPLHNLITFDVSDKVDMHLWKIMQTEPMQRLRRVKQLGFSDYVYPGATHTRFAHSVGVMHNARRMAKIITRVNPTESINTTDEKIAIFTALLHDIGHGPFSHAFEEALKDEKGNKTFDHEEMSQRLITEHQGLSQALECAMPDSDFPQKIANMLSKKTQKTIYSSVVSSQFDADRLDYMQRDALMTGTKHGAIDFEWLIANLKTGDIPTSATESTDQNVSIKCLIVDYKTIHATEAYLLGLLQLYQTVYFHKTTRGAEKLFTTLLKQIIQYKSKNTETQTGLPDKHPLIQFLRDPKNIDNFLLLDDTSILGALPMMQKAKNKTIANIAKRLSNRDLLKCIDLNINDYLDHSENQYTEKKQKKNKDDVFNRKISFDKKVKNIEQQIDKFNKANKSSTDGLPALLLDKGTRALYKSIADEEDPYKQIYYKKDNGDIMTLDNYSTIAKNMRTFAFARLYYDEKTPHAKSFAEDLKKDLIK